MGVDIRSADPVHHRVAGRRRTPAQPGSDRTFDHVPHVEAAPTPAFAEADSAAVLTASDERSPEQIIRELIGTHEIERRRIARDVHDVVGQALTAVRMHLEQICRAGAGSDAALEARHAILTVDHALAEVRDLAFEIRPQILDDLGLVAACRWLVGRQARVAGYRAVLDIGRVPSPLPVEVEAACFRTLQEALTNIARHAAAGRVTVALEARDGCLVLTVRDDGAGFDARRLHRRRRGPGLGLVGITERVGLVGGHVDLTSRVGSGTMLVARFPLGERS